MAAGVAGLRPGVTGAARRSEEQVEVMHALWVEPHVTFKGKAGSQLSYRMIDPVFINMDCAGAPGAGVPPVSLRAEARPG